MTVSAVKLNVTMTYLGTFGIAQEFRIVGTPTDRKWADTVKSGEPWCRFSVCPDHFVSSFGGAVWPAAWPELFQFGERSIHSGGRPTFLTDLGLELTKAAVAKALSEDRALLSDAISWGYDKYFDDNRAKLDRIKVRLREAGFL